MKKSTPFVADEKKINLSHSMAHYLMAIHQLKEEKGYARGIDIAKLLGLTKGSVSLALKKLKAKELNLVEVAAASARFDESIEELRQQIFSGKNKELLNTLTPEQYRVIKNGEGYKALMLAFFKAIYIYLSNPDANVMPS